MSKTEVGSSVIRTVHHSCVEGRLIQVHHAVDSGGENKFGIHVNNRHSRCLNYGFSISKCFNANNLQLGDGLSFQGRQQPPSTEKAVLNNSQALQDVVAGRKKEKTHAYDQDLPHTQSRKNRPMASVHHNVVCLERTLLFPLTGSSPVLPARTSAGAEVLAGGSLPVNKKQRRSLRRWARAIGYPSSTGPRGDPSPSSIRKRKKKKAVWSHLNLSIADKAFNFC